MTYLIALVNSGTVPVTGLTLTDDLGTYAFGQETLTPLTYVAGTVTYYINGTKQAAPTAVAGPPLVISGISVPAGGNTVIAYEAEVNRYAPLDLESNITNTAVISGNGITPISVNETVNARVEPILTITKSISPVPVTENGTLTYTFLIQNSGNAAADAASAAVIVDTFDPRLSNLSVSFNGTAWTEAENYTYDETTGLFSTTAGQVTVPAGTFVQDPNTGEWTVTPGISTLVVTGTI